MSEGIIIFLVAQALTLIGLVIGFYNKTTIKLKELELRVRMVEKQDVSILEKLDNISAQLTELRIEMQNKKDRD